MSKITSSEMVNFTMAGSQSLSALNTTFSNENMQYKYKTKRGALLLQYMLKCLTTKDAKMGTRGFDDNAGVLPRTIEVGAWFKT